MRNQHQIIDHFIARIRQEGVNLTKWEEDFMDSIEDAWNTWKHLSPAQEDALERIYTDRVP